MDNYGILSIVPAVIVIALALYTKKTMLSLILGSFVGVVILNGCNPERLESVDRFPCYI